MVSIVCLSVAAYLICGLPRSCKVLRKSQFWYLPLISNIYIVNHLYAGKGHLQYGWPSDRLTTEKKGNDLFLMKERTKILLLFLQHVVIQRDFKWRFVGFGFLQSCRNPEQKKLSHSAQFTTTASPESHHPAQKLIKYHVKRILSFSPPCPFAMKDILSFVHRNIFLNSRLNRALETLNSSFILAILFFYFIVLFCVLSSYECG